MRRAFDKHNITKLSPNLTFKLYHDESFMNKYLQNKNIIKSYFNEIENTYSLGIILMRKMFNFSSYITTERAKTGLFQLHTRNKSLQKAVVFHPIQIHS